MFYLLPPSGHVQLSVLRQAAVVRAEFLVAILQHKCETREQFQQLIVQLHRNRDAQFLIEQSPLDSLSHFALSALFIGKDWCNQILVNAEIELFKYRMACVNTDERTMALRSLYRESKLCATLPEDFVVTVKLLKRFGLRRFAKSVGQDGEDQSSAVLRVPFSVVLDLVSQRLVSLHRGMATVTACFFSSILNYLFITCIQIRQHSFQWPPYGTSDARLQWIESEVREKVLAWLNIGKETPQAGLSLTASKVEDVAYAFPPCMLLLHRRLRSEHRLQHLARANYTLFLKDIGLPLEENMKFWSYEYSKAVACKKGGCCHSWQKDQSRYTYGIHHLYGLVGSRKNYKTSCCHALQNVGISVGCQYGCPFRYLNKRTLEDVLFTSYSMSPAFIKELLSVRATGQYDLCCTMLQQQLILSNQSVPAVSTSGHELQEEVVLEMDSHLESHTQFRCSRPIAFHSPVDFFFACVQQTDCLENRMIRTTNADYLNAVVEGERTASVLPQPDISCKVIDAIGDCCGIRLETVVSSGLALMNLNGDGDWKLVVADLINECTETKLKVANSTGPLFTESVKDLVSGVVPVVMDETDRHTSTLAVATGQCLLFYRNMKPFFRMSVGDLEVSPLEQQIWQNAHNSKLDMEQAMKALSYLRSQLSFSKMSLQSQTYFTLKDDQCRQAYLASQQGEVLKCTTIITCISAIKKSLTSQEDVDWLIVGTEHGKLITVDCQLLAIHWTLQLPGKPCFIAVKGAHNQDHRILVCCRNNIVYAVRRSAKETNMKAIITLKCAAVGMVIAGEKVAIGTMDQCLSFYTTGGKMIWTKKLPASMLTLNNMTYPQKNFDGVLVALSNRTVHVYKEDGLCNIVTVDDNVMALCFGRFGHEKGALIMVMASGSLRIKLLRKNAKLSEKLVNEKAAIAVEQQQRLPMPKKSKLFIDQTNREQDNCRAIHERYQKGLLELRISTAEAYLAMLEKKIVPVTYDSGSSIQKNQGLNISAQVMGLGPRFRLDVQISSTAKQPETNFFICLLHDPSIYNFEHCVIEVPVLMPNFVHTLKTYLKVVKVQVTPSDVIISVHKENVGEPLQVVFVTMPLVESIDE